MLVGRGACSSCGAEGGMPGGAGGGGDGSGTVGEGPLLRRRLQAGGDGQFYYQVGGVSQYADQAGKKNEKPRALTFHFARSYFIFFI